MKNIVKRSIVKWKKYVVPCIFNILHDTITRDLYFKRAFGTIFTWDPKNHMKPTTFLLCLIAGYFKTEISWASGKHFGADAHAVIFLDI